MEYRNRPLYLFSLVAIALQPAVAAYFVFLDSGLSGDIWEPVLALSVPSAVAWAFLRAGVLPRVSWGDGRISVENPFVSYSAPLGKVRLVGRAGKGEALGSEGIGEVGPWALSRSGFDGKRANEARREMWHAVLRAVEGGDGAGERRGCASDPIRLDGSFARSHPLRLVLGLFVAVRPPTEIVLVVSPVVGRPPATAGRVPSSVPPRPSPALP